MYAGHLGFALGVSSLRRSVPLWLLLVAAQLPDWVDVGICATGGSRGVAGLHSHGFFSIAVSIGVLGTVYLLASRDWVGALVIALTTVSHYALDLLTGIKPTWTGGPIIGLGLYKDPVVDAVLEGATILIGWLLYRYTLPKERRNSIFTYAILLSLILFQAAAGIAFYLKLGGDVKC